MSEKSYVTDEELIVIKDAAKKRVIVACDEYHAHRWDCLHGPADALTILRLCETIENDRAPVQALATQFKRGLR